MLINYIFKWTLRQCKIHTRKERVNYIFNSFDFVTWGHPQRMSPKCQMTFICPSVLGNKDTTNTSCSAKKVRGQLTQGYLYAHQATLRYRSSASLLNTHS